MQLEVDLDAEGFERDCDQESEAADGGAQETLESAKAAYQMVVDRYAKDKHCKFESLAR
jgi:hypothetical protein